MPSRKKEKQTFIYLTYQSLAGKVRKVKIPNKSKFSIEPELCGEDFSEYPIKIGIDVGKKIIHVAGENIKAHLNNQELDDELVN